VLSVGAVVSVTGVVSPEVAKARVGIIPTIMLRLKSIAITFFFMLCFLLP
jgi:hypothetical protein